MEMEGAPGGMGGAIKELMKASCRRMWSPLPPPVAPADPMNDAVRR
jgi:hypothetical protein